MKFFITALGTRGDIEPFLAIGERLRQQNHEVLYSFPAQFEKLLPKSASFYPITPAFLQTIQSKDGRRVMGKGSLWSKLKALYRLYQKGKLLNRRIVLDHYAALEKEQPDVVIHHPKCSFPVLWRLHTGTESVIISPVPYVFYPVEGHAHIGFPARFGSIFNSLSYRLANYAWVKTISDAKKHIQNIPDFSKAQIKEGLKSSKFVYSISPVLFQRPLSWPKHVQVMGYHENTQSIVWKPDDDLENFISKHDKIVFLSFGSMVNAEPVSISLLLYQVMINLKIPSIVNTAEGGLVRNHFYNDHENLHFVDGITYSWILPKMYAMIHHGGSGTTHMALKYACPSLIIPHIIDQFVWNRLIAKLGFGPKGLSINKLAKGKITLLIKDLYHNPNYKKAVDKASKTMTRTNLEEQLINFLTNTTG